ncbi:hypothetical protein Scep_001611 [Stephania cephalantha]|uniref:Uncharacterized protein n=1 Tax=Stephania cephalantha TaxID=152367 RepID=A0AAP0Q3X9_9MAGN
MAKMSNSQDFIDMPKKWISSIYLAPHNNQRYWSRHLGRIVLDPYMCPVQVLLNDDISEVSKNHMWDAAKGGNDGNLPTIDQVFFEIRKKGGILVEPEDINKHKSLQEHGSRLEKLEDIVMQALGKTPHTSNNELDEVNMSIVILPMLEEFNFCPSTVVI